MKKFKLLFSVLALCAVMVLPSCEKSEVDKELEEIVQASAPSDGSVLATFATDEGCEGYEVGCQEGFEAKYNEFGDCECYPIPLGTNYGNFDVVMGYNRNAQWTANMYWYPEPRNDSAVPDQWGHPQYVNGLPPDTDTRRYVNYYRLEYSSTPNFQEVWVSDSTYYNPNVGQARNMTHAGLGSTARMMLFQTYYFRLADYFTYETREEYFGQDENGNIVSTGFGPWVVVDIHPIDRFNSYRTTYSHVQTYYNGL